jgi:hypothetical protein
MAGKEIVETSGAWSTTRLVTEESSSILCAVDFAGADFLAAVGFLAGVFFATGLFTVETLPVVEARVGCFAVDAVFAGAFLVVGEVVF